MPAIREHTSSGRSSAPPPYTEQRRAAAGSSHGENGWLESNVKHENQAERGWGVKRNSAWLCWHWKIIAEQWDSMVTKHQWSKLERLFDAEAQKRGYPQCSKTGSAIGAKLKNMDMDEAIELAFMGADEPVPLTEDEREFLATIKGREIITAVNFGSLSALCYSLAADLSSWAEQDSGRLVYQRCPDKLYSVLHREALSPKGWFHEKKKRQDDLEQMREAVENQHRSEMEEALRAQEQQHKVEVEYDRMVKESRLRVMIEQDKLAYKYQRVRGG